MTGAEITQTEKHISTIVRLLKVQRGFDFSGYRQPMLERRINKRIFKTNCSNFENYVDFIHKNPNELDQLIDVFTINVSKFYRNPLSFEYLRKIILPEIFYKKTQESESSLRVWSAGCSYGEEAYSIAILISEFLKKEESSIDLSVFATDLDKNALKGATTGLYNQASIENLKYCHVQSYFKQIDDKFKIDPDIQKKVQFSFYDLLDKKRMVPPESIYGGFDIVLCRNVLIYFELEHQKQIFEKLYRSLNLNGFLVLGEAEIPLEEFKKKFKRENIVCKVYRKIA